MEIEGFARDFCPRFQNPVGTTLEYRARSVTCNKISNQGPFVARNKREFALNTQISSTFPARVKTG